MKRPLLRRRDRGFTLIEMLTVMLIIAVLASLVLGTNALVQNNAARARAGGEIKTLELGCENYKADNGIYPRTKDTDVLDPRVDGNPVTGDSGKKYQDATKDLYKALSGDENVDFQVQANEKSYLPEFFKPNVLGGKKTKEGKFEEVKFIQDPFGHSYGYSTAGAVAEEDFQNAVRKNPGASRSSQQPGYNSTFDLWSTGGSVSGVTAAAQGKWVKNW